MTDAALAPDAPAPAARPGFGELVAEFARVGVLSFGGAAGQIAMMHRSVVEEKRWLDEPRYLHALNYCMLLPGPEAQQLATYIGWLLHGVRGGLAAGLLFVAPGAAVMLALSLLYVLGSGLTLVDGVFFGVKAAVLAIVTQALRKIAGRGLTGAPMIALAAAAFLAMLLLDAPFPLVVLGAGAVGALLGGAAPADAAAAAAGARPDGRAALRMAGWCLLAWWAPVALVALALGPSHLLVEIGLFFSQLAVLTFGGAYAVLAWLAQAGVEAGWATPGQMIDGLGLAETTPGPTILVNQFVAFLGGHGAGGIAMGIAAALMALWTTFAPSFLWIFAGAPFVEDVRRSARLAGALKGVTAAVVGVIGFVALWFGLNVLFGGVVFLDAGPLRVPTVALSGLDVTAAALAALAFLLLFRARWGVMPLVGLMATLGVAAQAAGLAG